MRSSASFDEASGESKYAFLGKVYELADFTSPTPESLTRLRTIIDEAFGRNPGERPVPTT
jgi:hypothetical protein